MLYENYKNATDTGKANIINFAAQQFIYDVYNEYVDVYMDRTEEYKEELKIRRDKMLDEIEVNTELIEKTRQIIREENKKGA